MSPDIIIVAGLVVIGVFVALLGVSAHIVRNIQIGQHAPQVPGELGLVENVLFQTVSDCPLRFARPSHAIDQPADFGTVRNRQPGELFAHEQ